MSFNEFPGGTIGITLISLSMINSITAGVFVFCITWIGYNKLDNFLRSYNIKPSSKGVANMTETKFVFPLSSVLCVQVAFLSP